ncbi:MAG: hypothetical protein R6U98_08785 [Pirellulaceae bacterium]
MSRDRIALITDQPGWHDARLDSAFRARGYETVTVSLCDCTLDVSGTHRVITLPGFHGELPTGVFVRGVSGGTLQEIVFQLNILHVLQAEGITVYNDARAIERSVDKALTSFLLARAGLSVPPTRITCDQEDAVSFTQQELAAGHSVVCKPLFGAQGEGIARIDTVSDLPTRDQVCGVWYLQRFIQSELTGSSDWRVFVIRSRTVAMIRRSSAGWLTNVCQGGYCHAGFLDPSIVAMAEAAATCLSMNYAGVDMLCDLEGQWWVLEVNSIPAWRGLQNATGVEVAKLLVDDLLVECQQQGLDELAS